MARSDEAAAFFYAVYSAVQQVPHGKVTTYGHIAMLVGTPQRPRQVGVCLKHLPSAASSADSRHNSSTVPWQRVINSKGQVSPRSSPEGTQNQATALRVEGVQVTTSALGELCVDLDEYGWFPQVLPSEEDDEDEDEEDDDRE